MVKIVETPSTLSEAAGYIFKAVGLGNFRVDAVKLGAVDNFRVTALRQWDAPGHKMQDETSAIAWLHEIGKDMRKDVLECELVTMRLAEKDKVIAELTQRLTMLSEQVQGLVPYRMHYEMEFELQHGRARDVCDPDKPA